MLVSQTAVSPLPSPQQAAPANSGVDPEVAAQNRKLSAAVKLLNETTAAGSSHEFSIAIDPTTRQAVVRIVDSSTREVVEQLPSEYLLRVARQLSERIAQSSLPAADRALSV